MVPRRESGRFIAYYRVSTDRQGKSGLGLDAQKAAVVAHMKRFGGTLRAEFTEIQSGKDDARPQLQEALRLCKLTNSVLLIAKLDRLSRNVAFLATLQQSSTRFVACDMPEANELVVHILAAVAQAERQAISDRTRAALAAARNRGVKLGNPSLKPGTKATALVASDANVRTADARATELSDVVAEAKRQGRTTLRQIADHLNEMGVFAARGGTWHPNSVRRLVQRTEMAG